MPCLTRTGVAWQGVASGATSLPHHHPLRGVGCGVAGREAKYQVGQNTGVAKTPEGETRRSPLRAAWRKSEFCFLGTNPATNPPGVHCAAWRRATDGRSRAVVLSTAAWRVAEKASCRDCPGRLACRSPRSPRSSRRRCFPRFGFPADSQRCRSMTAKREKPRFRRALVIPDHLLGHQRAARLAFGLSVVTFAPSALATSTSR
jgi:hypothetical protein